jgi:hypothetical protein
MARRFHGTLKYHFRGNILTVELQIYSFLFASWPFWYLGEDEMLMFQMIGFVEKLPAEWQPKWESIVKSSSRDLELEEGN